MINIIEANNKETLILVKNLFIDYSKELNVSLCFQNFDNEVSNLPGIYSRPNGCIFLAFYNGEAAGCVALKKLEEDVCEMKRLYVKPDFRKFGIGKLLIDRIIQESRIIGYSTMKLDTLARLKPAIKLYNSYGFNKIVPYYENPLDNVVYMELDLKL